MSCYNYLYIIVAQMWPECGPKAARMRPEFKILRPEISPCKFPVARAQPGLKLQARNPTRTMKKVARPSPKCNLTVNPLSSERREELCDPSKKYSPRDALSHYHFRDGEAL